MFVCLSVSLFVLFLFVNAHVHESPRRKRVTTLSKTAQMLGYKKWFFAPFGYKETTELNLT